MYAHEGFHTQIILYCMIIKYIKPTDLTYSRNTSEIYHTDFFIRMTVLLEYIDPAFGSVTSVIFPILPTPCY